MTPTTQITLTVNGEPRKIAAETSLSTLVEQLGRPAAAVAVERNGEIVPRGRWGETRLEAGDRLEIVQFVQGGAQPAARSPRCAAEHGG